MSDTDPYRGRREALAQQLADKGISDAAVLRAIATVPRHRFAAPEFIRHAYDDQTLPLDEKQTISQPFIVAYMTAVAIDGREVDKLLEIGTGSGYQAAIASQVAERVFSVECRDTLFFRARGVLRDLGYANVNLRRADGAKGWAQFAPYEAIIMTAASPEVPKSLLDQLAVGGRLVAPLGRPDTDQDLTVVTRSDTGYRSRKLCKVRFVTFFEKDSSDN